MKNNDLKNLYFLTSLRFFMLIILAILIFFNFFDIFLFELSRSFPGIIFNFFKEVIDPISEILDPLNFIVLFSLILFLNFNVKSILNDEKKFSVIKDKTNYNREKIEDLFNYISLVSKHFIFSLTVAGIVCNILKYIFGVSRPKYFFLEGYERFNFFNFEHKISSFPSGHTQAAFSLAVLLIIYFRRYFLVIIFLATMMGLSRIFMSMHFPSDLIAGAYLGSVVPILFYDKIFKKKIEKIKKKHGFSFSDILKLMYLRIFI